MVQLRSHAASLCSNSAGHITNRGKSSPAHRPSLTTARLENSVTMIAAQVCTVKADVPEPRRDPTALVLGSSGMQPRLFPRFVMQIPAPMDMHLADARYEHASDPSDESIATGTVPKGQSCLPSSFQSSLQTRQYPIH